MMTPNILDETFTCEHLFDSLENETLYTANDKHYKCVPDLLLSVFRP